ncbi:MAG: M48 family metalloprotease, partial [Gammaproteobacteria bacterium]|nr:M48 family metalloprotease [Gammaproteobacteria bacterium]
DLNAWALPGGKLAINRGLLMELKSEAELAAVLSHEIVHAAARHGAHQMENAQLMQIGGAVASIAASAYGGSQLGELVGQGAAVGSQLMQLKYSRDDELEADKYGMKYMKSVGYDLQAAVSLQELFLKKFEGKQNGSTLFASHPPSAERVAQNRETMANQGGPGGDVGTDRYQQAMGRLMNSAPAYAKADQALAAANKEDFASARSLVSEAIRMEPREARFHLLLGEIEAARKNPQLALTHFEQAQQLDPGYFKPIAEAGIVQYQLGNRAAAEPLLVRGMQLLPTAPNAYYLGRLFEDRGDTAEAVKLYKLVAGSKSQLGADAMSRLTRLDLGQNPETYLSIQPQMDDQGRVWLIVGNRTPTPIGGVTIMVGVVDQGGNIVAGPERVTTGGSVIPPQKAVNLRTGLGPFQSREALRYVKWKVEGAQAQ